MKKPNYSTEDLKSVPGSEVIKELNTINHDERWADDVVADELLVEAEAIIFDAFSNAMADVRRNNPGAPTEFLAQQAVLYERRRSRD